MHILSCILGAVLVLGSVVGQPCSDTPRPPRKSGRVDTQGWFGAEYTPGLAGGDLFWNWYDDYEAEIERELKMMGGALRYNTVRMFLHSLIWEKDNGTTLFAAVDKFLASASKNNIVVGLVYFDDCHRGSGANLSSPCVPTKGYHNGCWFTSPQTADRTSVDRYRNYVQSVAKRYGNDSRVTWLELTNEPHGTNPPNPKGFDSCELRSKARDWVDALSVEAPVLACWSDNSATDAVDFHEYSTDFASWNSSLYSNIPKGAFQTEAGSRWFQGQKDMGSPLTVLHFYGNLHLGPMPFVPGMMINWEVMVGGSNTRWQWTSKPGDPEPAIPWDANIMVDGTPVSYTEVGVLRAYASARLQRHSAWSTLFTESLEFLFWETFLPALDGQTFLSNDEFLTLNAGQTWTSTSTSSSTWGGRNTPQIGANAVVETTIWPSTDPTDVPSLLLLNTIAIQVNGSAQTVTAVDTSTKTILGSVDMHSYDCGLISNGWNMLRIEITQTTLSVWVNPMFIDATNTETPVPTTKIQVIPPRFTVNLPSPNPKPAPVEIHAGTQPVKIDYISALPITWQPHAMRGKW